MDVAGVKGAVALWARSEIRRRWTALVVLGVLAGTAAGLTMAAVDGAGRGRSAYERMHRGLRGADAVLFPSQVGAEVDITRLGELPEVAAWAGFALTTGQFDEIPGAGPIVPVGSAWFDTIERAKVIEGRLPDPTRDDEAVINPAAVAEGLHIGDVLTWRNLSAEQLREMGPYNLPPDFDWSTAEGPVTPLRIVGVVRIPLEPVGSFTSGPQLWPSPGWAAAHLDEAATLFVNALVRLRNGPADVPAFQAGVAELYGRDDLPVVDLGNEITRVQRSLDTERAAVLLFGAAVVAAALVLAGQALVRSVRVGTDTVPVLRSMGVPTGWLVAGLLAPHVLAAAVAGSVAVAVAIALSTRFPLGLGRLLDPDPGLHVNLPVLVIGAVVTIVLVVLGCLIAAWRLAIDTRSLADRRSSLLGALMRAGAPVPVAVGASLALEPAPRRSSSRAALIAATASIIGVIAAVSVTDGIDGMVDNAPRTGQAWDLLAHPNESLELPEIEATIADTPGIRAASLLARQPDTVNGRDAPLYSVTAWRGTLDLVIRSGRAPRAEDEVAIGPRTAAVSGLRIGDLATVGAQGRELRVVGLALLPQTPHSSFDEGAWLLPAAFDEITGTMCCTGEREEGFLVTVERGASVEDVGQALLGADFTIEAPSPPNDVLNLLDIRRLPLYLAAFLVLLGIGAAAHALLTGAQSRSRELAVLRALGLSARQAAACITWQSAVIGALAVALGIPVGVVTGRWVWRIVADSLSFIYVAPLPRVVLAATVPVALGVLAVLVVWPARRAARLNVADTLRGE